MKLEPFTGPGSTPSRRRFWDKVTQVVIASQKVAGDNVSVDEHQGAGTIINVPFPERGRAPAPIGACCYDDGTCDDLTEADCNDAGGNWQGSDTPCSEGLCVGVCCEESGCVDGSTPDSCAADGGTWVDFQTTCADDPNPCAATGACCIDSGCSILSEDDCISGGGTYRGDETTCDYPSICCPCGFDAFDGSGRKFLTQTCTYTDAPDGGPCLCGNPPCGPDVNNICSGTTVHTIDPDTCEVTSDGVIECDQCPDGRTIGPAQTSGCSCNDYCIPPILCALQDGLTATTMNIHFSNEYLTATLSDECTPI